VSVTLRAMTLEDLALFESWLRTPHFGQWFLQDATIESELADNAAAITGAEPTTALIVQADGHDVGWAQWYRYDDWADEVPEYEVLPGEVGIDYGIGEPTCVSRGIGTAMIAELVGHVRAAAPGASIMTAPSAANRASCRVLEKNGFALVSLRSVADEPNASPLAFYRLGPAR